VNGIYVYYDDNGNNDDDDDDNNNYYDVGDYAVDNVELYDDHDHDMKIMMMIICRSCW